VWVLALEFDFGEQGMHLPMTDAMEPYRQVTTTRFGDQMVRVPL
jgi:hypothetical protein